MNTPKAFTLIALLVLLLTACLPTGTENLVTPASPIPPEFATTDPALCPQATPELLRVAPVTSPTSEGRQAILVEINNGASVTVATASGTFEGRPETGTSADGFNYNFVVDVDLQPNTTHELTVEATIREIVQNGCQYGGYTLSTTRDSNGNPLVITQAAAGVDITPTLCPQATPEWLRVAPVTSPTGEDTQAILVEINNGASVSVTTASGTFTGRAETGTSADGFNYNFVVDVDLLPNTTHELTVEAAIRQIEQNGCTYGGYTLSTNRDINGDPLVIAQEAAGAEIPPTLCPQATPEWLRVRPVTSPTNELRQAILVDINNGESVTVTTVSGTFEGRPGRGSSADGFFSYNFIVDIELLPNTTHELIVEATIREIEQGGCTYGGYALTATRDINGDPLVIVQQSE